MGTDYERDGEKYFHLSFDSGLEKYLKGKINQFYTLSALFDWLWMWEGGAGRQFVCDLVIPVFQTVVREEQFLPQYFFRHLSNARCNLRVLPLIQNHSF